MANTAAGERRVALTRDVGLLKRSIVTYGYWVRNTDPEVQLAEVLDRFDLVNSDGAIRAVPSVQHAGGSRRR